MHARAPFQVAERSRLIEALCRFGFATLISSDEANTTDCAPDLALIPVRGFKTRFGGPRLAVALV
jgi:hypothetical protein